MKMQLVSLPDEPPSEGFRTQLITEFWGHLHDGADSGAATWEELDRLEQEVTGCLAQKPPDILSAESLTAYAMLLISGYREF